MTALPPVRTPQGAAPDLSSRCAGCAAPLAPDQLFCLSCGTRRRDARIAFRDVLASEAVPIVSGPGGPGGPTVTQHAATAPGQPPQAGSYTPFIAMLASILLALVIGVWIGRGQEAPAATAAPIAMPVAATTAAPAAADPAADAAADDSADAAADDTAAEDDAAAEDSSDADTGAATVDTKKLESLSPEEYQKQSQKMPKEVGTGGKPPAKDGKTGGGGTEFESFE